MTEAHLTADIHASLAALMAKPKTHVSIVTYSDGSEMRTPAISAAAAHANAARYARFIGNHEYISRATGQKITIVSCEVEAL